MFSDGGLGKGVTNHSLMKQQSCSQQCPRKASATENRAQIIGSIEEIWAHSRGASDGCLSCPRWYEAAAGEAWRCYSSNTSSGAASHETQSNAADTMATMLHPASSVATASTNTTVEWLYAQQLYHQYHQYSTASSATRRLLQYWHKWIPYLLTLLGLHSINLLINMKLNVPTYTHCCITNEWLVQTFKTSLWSSSL